MIQRYDSFYRNKIDEILDLRESISTELFTSVFGIKLFQSLAHRIL